MKTLIMIALLIIAFIISIFLKSKIKKRKYKVELLKKNNTQHAITENKDEKIRITFKEKTINVIEPNEEFLNQKVNVFEPFLKKNSNELQKILNNNGITKLYHITDVSNLESIKNNNCLYSWDYAKKNNINICKPGGNELSRNLDMRYGVQNFVRLCFTTNHPMIFNATKDGRMIKPVVLEFDPKIILHNSTKFCPINATDNYAVIGDSVHIFNQIRFDIIRRNGFIEDTNERRYKQAEVLIFEKLSLDYLTKEPYYWKG